jgi:hypothetical protein
MRRGYLFWGSILILLAALFLLKAVGFIADVLGFFWPLALILLGVWIIVAIYLPKGFDDGEAFSIDAQGASQATIKFSTGAGRVDISAGAEAGKIISGTKAAGMNIKQSLEGDKLEVKVESGPSVLPFIGPSSGIWKYQLTKEIPLSLKVEAGASQVKMDLRDLRVTYASVETGASSVIITLPENAGNTVMDVEAGAASVDILVPDRVGARIRVKEGVSALNIDSTRFPRLDGGYYQNAEYDTSANKVDLTIESGVGSIKIR